MPTSTATTELGTLAQVAPESAESALPATWQRPASAEAEPDFEATSGVILTNRTARDRFARVRRWAFGSGLVLVGLVISPLLIYVAGLMALVAFPLLPLAGFLFAPALVGPRARTPRAGSREASDTTKRDTTLPRAA